MAALSRPRVRDRQTLCRAAVPDRVDDLLRGFELRQVAGAAQELESGEWDGGGVGAALVGVEDLVAVAPQHPGGQLRVGETSGRVGSLIAAPA
jgi:hypothetical protein